ncbi:MAG: glycosyltransferase family 4 protein [Chloroflexi bacterium]|nr:glycosyltransferase family 4 protein [Chloroflexota bacterium]
MQIIFLATDSLSSPGSGGRYFPLARALVRLGQQVTWVGLHHDYASTKQHRFAVNGVEIWYIGQMHVRKVASRKIYFNPLTMLWIAAWATWGLFRAAWKLNGDIIHVCKSQPMNLLAAWMVHKLRGTPVYLDSSDYEALVNRFQHVWQQKIVAWFEDWSPSFMSGITVQSTFLAERFQSLGYPRDRIYLIPHGIDEERFAVLDRQDVAQTLDRLKQSLGITPKDRVIVYVGSMSLVLHAVDILMEAFVMILKSEPSAFLLMIGGGEDYDALREMARRLGIESRVCFVGKVDSAQVPYYYRLGEVSVDSRRDSAVAQASLPLKVLESIATGIPCVATDTGDTGKVLDGAGKIVTPGDANALAQGILEIVNNPQVVEQMRTVAMTLRHQYSWNILAQRLLKIY